ncbi:transcriptional regulator [Leptospira tipperaryensis]|uniref:Transcriptional regulator n=1 Tax=Leptospira tipperaryensis TaxID=2564040 RepID=A0A1D7UU58_9LEPT|nr:MerR family transcriptional regulator [Leptospira tipperaryensis]AOP33083.1 transcriptional regulator [Leptospira tipperaryensis]
MKKKPNPAKDEDSNQKELELDLEILGKLVVGIGEVSEITQIPVRKIRYWEDKGIIRSLTEEEGKNRRYDYRNIKKILLIKELLDEGFTLEAAAKKVENRIATVNSVFEQLTKFKKTKS